VPAGLDVEHSDDLAAGHRDDRPGGGMGELCGALADVDRGSVAIPVRSPATAAKSSAIARESLASAGLTMNCATGICSHFQPAIAGGTDPMHANSRPAAAPVRGVRSCRDEVCRVQHDRAILAG